MNSHIQTPIRQQAFFPRAFLESFKLNGKDTPLLGTLSSQAYWNKCAVGFKALIRHRRPLFIQHLQDKLLIAPSPSWLWQAASWNVLEQTLHLLRASALPRTRLSVGETRSESCRLISCSPRLQVLLWIPRFFCSERISVPPHKAALRPVITSA